jgi:SAM-dependent methyltransferase
MVNKVSFLAAYEELARVGYDNARISEIFGRFVRVADFKKSLKDFLTYKRRVLDVCCGKPTKIREIAQECPGCHFIGVDVNPGMAKFYHGPNLSFAQADINSQLPDFDVEGVMALHACGDMSDKAIELSVKLDVPVLVVPCCYSKGEYAKPLSKVFRQPDMQEVYFDLLRRVKSGDNCKAHQRGIAGLIRALFNQDRVARVEEAERRTRLVKLRGLATPHNLAIVSD